MTARQAHRQDGFTLTELMIAVLVLVVVIVGTSKIFGTASKVTGLGEASADVLQETAAIERRIRTDLANLSPEGFFMIRAVAVRNDLNTPSGPLLNPVLAPNAWIRADQLMFFTQGAQVIETMGTRLGAENSDDLRAQGMVSRVYYGPAFQLPQAGKAETSDGGATMHAHDAQLDLSNPLVPWYNGTYPTVRTPFKMVIPWGDYPPAFDGEINATQPPANRWLLARHALILADDQDAHLQDPLGSQYLSHPTANTIGDGVVLNGRVDAVSTNLDDIRRTVVDLTNDGVLDAWPVQRDTIATALFYPRAERRAPSMHRIDLALTSNVLASACSSFMVDWTYENGAGFTQDPLSPGAGYLGVGSDTSLEQPWFGLDQAGDPSTSRQVQTYRYYFENLPSAQRPQTVFWQNIESFDPPTTTTGAAIQNRGAVVYEAIFGYNQQKPLSDDPTSSSYQAPDVLMGYTPWPTAIRITMVLHDAENKIENGREVQFVITLPKRVAN